MPHFQTGLSLLEAENPDHPRLTGPLEGLAACAADAGDHLGAVRLLERALRIAAAGTRAPLTTAEIRFRLARELWTLGRDRRRAAVLARQARDAYQGTDTSGRGEIEAWLAARHL